MRPLGRQPDAARRRGVPGAGAAGAGAHDDETFPLAEANEALARLRRAHRGRGGAGAVGTPHRQERLNQPRRRSYGGHRFVLKRSNAESRHRSTVLK